MVSYLLATRMLNFRYRTALTWLEESGFYVNERTTNPDSSFTSLAALGIESFCIHISSLPFPSFPHSPRNHYGCCYQFSTKRYRDSTPVL